jgi:hypothetical protein
VFRSENLVLEGFTDAPQNDVLEVSSGICTFAFFAPFSHASATLRPKKLGFGSSSTQ